MRRIGKRRHYFLIAARIRSPCHVTVRLDDKRTKGSGLSPGMPGDTVNPLTGEFATGQAKAK